MGVRLVSVRAAYGTRFELALVVARYCGVNAASCADNIKRLLS